jgi:hypothetical protein
VKDDHWDKSAGWADWFYLEFPLAVRPDNEEWWDEPDWSMRLRGCHTAENRKTAFQFWTGEIESEYF